MTAAHTTAQLLGRLLNASRGVLRKGWGLRHRNANVNEIITKFGGTDQLRSAVNQLQTLLYAV
jgi:hypothetical protein